MSGSRKVTVTASVVLLFCLAGSVFLLRRLDQMRTTATLEEILYLNSPKWVKRLSLGYDGLLADIYWTRAVQYFGSHHVEKAKDYNLLSPLLEITTALDPKLIVAYQFGANFLGPKPPLGAGQPDKAVALLEYGIRNNPDNWKLYYELGFFYYMEEKDYAKAAEAFERGIKVPNSHPFLRVLAAQMAQHAGEFDTARMLWYTTYQSTTEAQIRQNAVEHLQALRVDEDVTRLEEVVAKYRQQTGDVPATISDLERVGLIRGTPMDPTDRPYKLTSDGRIEVQDPDRIPFITKGLPPGMESPQPKTAKKD
ncbi:MAG TPA: tetratricopeptide repeat protein [Terriglobales bacterium]